MRVEEKASAAEVLAARDRYVPRGIAASDLVVARAWGARIWDAEGREYIDFAGGIACQNLGHGNAAVVRAIHEQVDRFLHQCFMVGAYEPYVAVAEKLDDLWPGNAATKTLLLNSGAEAIENAVKREVANGMKQFRSFLDKLIQTGGNGVLGTIATGGVSGNVLTMTVPNGAALVYVGQTIQVYDTTLTTNRGSCNVVAADPIGAQTITVDSLPAGTIATDVIVHDGLSGAQPVSLYGIKYHQNNASTGTWLNLNRATYPQQLATPRVNAANSALVPGYVRLAINKVRKSLGIGQLGELVAYTSVEQEHAWENLGITISQVIKEGAGGRANDLDLLFSGRKTMSGVPIKSSINADQTRVDFLDLSHWGRAVMKDIDFFEIGGQTVFPIYGSSGGVSAAFIFYFDTGFQVWNDSPRSGAYVDGLARPSGY